MEFIPYPAAVITFTMLNTILTGEGVLSDERFLIQPFTGKGGGKGMGEMGIFFYKLTEDLEVR